MRVLYLDCGMGAAGDMLSAALLELFPNPDAVLADLNATGIPGVEYMPEKSVKNGVTGTHMKVLVNGVEESENLYTHEHGEHHAHEHHHEHDHDHAHAHGEHNHEHEHAHEHGEHSHEHEHAHEHGEHHHSGTRDIEKIVSGLHLPENVKTDVLSVYNIIAEAESAVHGKTVNEIHFHEVGTMDAIADVTAVCYFIRRLGIDKIIASPVRVGYGEVHCAHGILPVPAPATALILKDIPIYSGDIKGELCTPTGAALLKYFVKEFNNDMPVMQVNSIGYGMGKKDFPRANCVRAMLGDIWEKNNKNNKNQDAQEIENAENMKNTDDILELSCNLDDMTAEEIGFVIEKLYQDGAKEVYTIPVGMKKNRPGVLLCVLCDMERREKILEILFRHTTTIGVREAVFHRYILNREEKICQTPYGEIRRKYVSGYGVSRYDDLARVAREQGVSLREARRTLERYIN